MSGQHLEPLQLGVAAPTQTARAGRRPVGRELVFTIRDRTGAEYSFGGRSPGLTHFLAYFVQIKAHRPAEDRDEILLMDEPNAYLSNSGQQDLLRVLENFAIPDDRVRTDQVIYVTHSPFLINKNAADRLRALDRGAREGTFPFMIHIMDST